MSSIPTQKHLLSLTHPSIPQPKFWFNQRVCNEWICDDELDGKYGLTIRDYGVVVGMVYRDSWDYYVRWERLGMDAHLPLPHIDCISEEELMLI
ncbi:hypothetical protein WJM97_21920 [Okeanomitos corallinicola TIOX110]|uniref:Uncharacterized protein n=1 Tax=Okeanomitos corallinicola TIOX110 TaxID=3133117 RepID=A0ABZ2URH8_9CYAN